MARLPSPDELSGRRPSLDVGGGVRASRPPDVPHFGQEAEGMAALGRALGSAAGDVATVAVREQEHAESVRTEDAFNKLRANQLDLTLGDENGFHKLLGGDAVNREKPLLDDWSAKFDEKAKAIETSLSDDRSKERFKQRAAVAKISFQGDILRHVASQTDAYSKDTLKNTLDAEARNVGASPTSDADFGFSAERVGAAVEREARRLGQDPAVAKAKAVDHLWISRLEALRLEDPAAAMKTFQDNQKTIGPDVRVKLAESLFNDAKTVLAAQLNDAGGAPVSASTLARVRPGYEKRDFNERFDTILTPGEEKSFQSWKSKYAPNDSGADYDLRGAFKAGVKPAGPEAGADEGHFPDTFKKPNHPTFSNESRYAPFGTPGRWEGQKFIPGKNEPRGIRNNNPGNIVAGPTKWEGEIEGGDPRYASFASPEAGVRALGKNLLSYQAKGIDTVEGIIGRWAPATENDTAKYVETVSKKMGVNPREPLDLRDRKTLTGLATAIIEHENGKNPYSGDTISSGLDSASSGKPFAYEAKRSPGYSVASMQNLSATEVLGIQTGNKVIDRLPPDQKLAVFQTARTQSNQGMTQVREAMKQRVIDTTAAFERGQDSPNPPTRSELIATFGQFDGEKMAGDLDLSQAFGRDVRSVQQLPATQQAALLASRAPVPGEGFAAAEKRHEALARAVDATQKARQQDPALSVMQNAPQVRDAYQAFATSQGDKVNGSAQGYAAATLAEQSRLEIRNPQILTKDMVDAIAKRFAEPPKAGENVSSIMRGMVDQWGRYWPVVGAQLKGKLPPEATVIGLGVAPEAEALLAETSKLKPEALRQGIDDATTKDIRERVRQAFEPLQSSVVWQSGGIETYDNFADSGEKIAIALVQKGMKPKDAAAKAFEGLAGFKYEFESTWRVPKAELGGDVSPSLFRQGAEATKRDIGSDKPVLGEKVGLLVPSTPAGVRKEDADRQWRDTIVSNGFWVTSPGDGGLSLYVKSGLGAQPVLDDQGMPVRRSWDQLSGIGRSVRAARFSDVYTDKRKP